MRALYVLLTYLVAPIVLAFEAWQALKHVDHRGRIGQRLGYGAAAREQGGLWIHAVSVGEVQAAAGLVHELRRRHPSLPIVITTVTPTGAQRVRTLFKGTVQHCYLPLDLPGAMRRFLDRIRPGIAVILETEIWPTLYAELGRRGIPLVLGSARVSVKSVERFRYVAPLVRGALSQDLVIGAQTATDAERFRAIGAPPDRIQVTGNIKYDLEIPPDQVAAGQALRAAWDVKRPVWIAGSTHENEEEAALVAHAIVREHHPDALLLLVPRHPQRFESVRQLLRRRGVAFAQRSASQLPGAGDEVFLIDTVGELQMFYAAADVAFVGGSLVPVGGHSLLEPAVLGVPVLSGPHTQNSQDAAELLERAGALRIVRNDEALGAALLRSFDDPAPARAAGEHGRAAVAANRGAVARLVALIEPRLRASGAPRAASSSRSGSR